MVILEDSRQQAKKHEAKHRYFIENGIGVSRETLSCGDYQIAGKSDVAVDTKNSIAELIGDIQKKKMPKKDVMEKVNELIKNQEHADALFHIITDDDFGHDVDNEITMYCYKNHISEELIAPLQKLYIKRHGFFHRGLIRSQVRGTKLYVLVENKDGVKSVKDLFSWVNPALLRYRRIQHKKSEGKWQSVPLASKEPMKGEYLAKACLTMELKYGVKFEFCTPEEAGAKVIELLTTPMC